MRVPSSGRFVVTHTPSYTRSFALPAAGTSRSRPIRICRMAHLLRADSAEFAPMTRGRHERIQRANAVPARESDSVERPWRSLLGACPLSGRSAELTPEIRTRGVVVQQVVGRDPVLRSVAGHQLASDAVRPG